jgi:hypothetical protein
MPLPQFHDLKNADPVETLQIVQLSSETYSQYSSGSLSDEGYLGTMPDGKRVFYSCGGVQRSVAEADLGPSAGNCSDYNDTDTDSVLFVHSKKLPKGGLDVTIFDTNNSQQTPLIGRRFMVKDLPTFERMARSNFQPP